MKTFIIIHGWDGDSRSGWFKWLKTELEKKGYNVLTPQMPNPGEPIITDWVQKIFDITKNLGEETYFIGHSIGCQAILRYLEKYNVKIGGAIFVAGFFDLKENAYTEYPDREKESRRIAGPWINTKINFSNIKIPEGKNFAIFSDNDPHIDLKNAKIFEQKLKSKIIIEHKKDHYEEGTYKTIPVIMEIINKNFVNDKSINENIKLNNNKTLEENKMTHELPKLAYKYDALEPFIDAKTMEIHYSKHHQTYVDKLNAALEPFAGLKKAPVEALLTSLTTIPEGIRNAVRNHGGGHYNHSMFWFLLKKDVKISKEIKVAIDKEFGGYDKFKEKFTESANKVFGSGWTWLVVNKGKLEIVNTSNQDNPLTEGKIPILGIDLWEHAFYILRQNKRPEWIEAFYNVINWDNVNKLYKDALKSKSFSV